MNRKSGRWGNFFDSVYIFKEVMTKETLKIKLIELSQAFEQNQKFEPKNVFERFGKWLKGVGIGWRISGIKLILEDGRD